MTCLTIELQILLHNTQYKKYNNITTITIFASELKMRDKISKGNT